MQVTSADKGAVPFASTMVAIRYCSACQFGRHKDHKHVVRAVPEGMYGGAVCTCKGECKEDFERRLKAVDGNLWRLI